jgi:hypothetical protein
MVDFVIKRQAVSDERLLRCTENLTIYPVIVEKS